MPSSPSIPRVASLIPSGTDIVAALGLEENLVGVSHACGRPGLPVLTRSSLPHSRTVPPAVIDQQVAETLDSGGALYLTDHETLASLVPDVVLAQDICDVCAVSAAQASAAVPPGAELIVLQATGLAGLADDIQRVGKALGVTDRAVGQVQAMQAALAAVGSRVEGLRRPRVLALEWGDPPFLGGHWVPELVGLAGGEHVLSGPGAASRRSTWAEIADADPDIIVFMPCGYSLDEAFAEGHALLAQPEVASLRAVRQERFWVADADSLFSRCTPAVVTAANVLAAICHPDHFPAADQRKAVRL